MNAGNGEKLTEYRFEELRADLCEIKRDVGELRKSIEKFGGRLGKVESRVDTLYWLIPVAITLTGLFVGIINMVMGG